MGSRLCFFYHGIKEISASSICERIPYFFQPFFAEKTSKNRDSEWFGVLLLQPNWSDKPLKTRRIRENWTDQTLKNSTDSGKMDRYVLVAPFIICFTKTLWSEKLRVKHRGGKSGFFISPPGYFFTHVFRPSCSSQCREFSKRVSFLALGFVRSKSLFQNCPKTAVKIGKIHFKCYHTGSSIDLQH